MIRVLVAEDMRILADALAAVLNLEDDIEVVAQVSDGTAIVPAAARVQADVAVVDIHLPGADGLSAAEGLREQCPRCRVLILTVLGNPGNLRRALAAGVAGFLPKETPADELADAVRTVAAGGKVISHKLAVAALEAPDNPLSPREAEALWRFSAGAGPAEIAAAMFLTNGTVRNYLAAAVSKLGARNRTDAIRIATEAGWLLAATTVMRPPDARLRRAFFTPQPMRAASAGGVLGTGRDGRRNPTMRDNRHRRREGNDVVSKVWFVTGSSRGLGRSFVEAALSRGDQVAATARNPERLAELVAVYSDAVLPLELDVTDKAAVFESVKRAREHFGRLDVIVNNAGYGLFGAVEELDEQQLRDEFETNLFGALRVVQAALPYLREQGTGHIIQMSSIGGLIAMPIGGGYLPSKWALEAMNESLAQEVADLGIKVTLVEPFSYATGSTSGVYATPNPVYDRARQTAAGFMKGLDAGDPAAAARALLKIVDSATPPLRVLFGIQGYGIVRQVYTDRLKTWADWKDLSAEAHGTLGQPAGDPRAKNFET